VDPSGKKHRESSESTDRADAVKLLDRRQKEKWAEQEGLRSFNPKAEKTAVGELLDALEKDYKLRKRRGLTRQDKTHLKPMKEAFADVRAVDITAKYVDDYIERRLDEGLSHATINRETQHLRRAFRLAFKRREILVVPDIRKLPENNVRQGFFEPAEFKALVAALPEYLQDFVRFAYLCAWRKGQIVSLTWADVDRGGGVVLARAENVKSGRAHKLVLVGELAEIIERRWEAREYETSKGTAISQYVFHRNGQPIKDPRRAWAAACVAAGLVKPKLDKTGEPVYEIVDGERKPVLVPSRIFHDFRRSGVRNMVRAGVRESVAMAISGHRTRAIFDRYNITSDEDLRQAVKQTQEHLKSQPAKRKVVAFRKK
jgi:integrase